MSATNANATTTKDEAGQLAAEVLRVANIDRSHFGQGARYRHHKGGTYSVICTSQPKDNRNDVQVVYRHHQSGQVYNCPVAEWFGYVEGTSERRYAPCDEKGRVFSR